MHPSFPSFFLFLFFSFFPSPPNKPSVVVLNMEDIYLSVFLTTCLIPCRSSRPPLSHSQEHPQNCIFFRQNTSFIGRVSAIMTQVNFIIPFAPPVMNKFTAYYFGLDLWQNTTGTNNLICQHLSKGSSINVTNPNLNSKVHLTARPWTDYSSEFRELLQTGQQSDY